MLSMHDEMPFCLSLGAPARSRRSKPRKLRWDTIWTVRVGPSIGHDRFTTEQSAQASEAHTETGILDLSLLFWFVCTWTWTTGETEEVSIWLLAHLAQLNHRTRLV